MIAAMNIATSLISSAVIIQDNLAFADEKKKVNKAEQGISQLR